MQPSRRRFISIASVTGFGVVAGCIADGTDDERAGGTDDDDDDDDDDDESEVGDGDDHEDDGSGDDEEADDETVHYSISTGDTHAAAFFTADEALDEVELEALSEEKREEVEAFIEATDFEEAVIVLLRAHVHNLCYGLELEYAEADADGVRARAAAVDRSDDDEDCAQAVDGPTMLVRVEHDGDVARSGSVTVVDSQGSEHGFGFDSASEGVPADSGGETDDSEEGDDENDERSDETSNSSGTDDP